MVSRSVQRAGRVRLACLWVPLTGLLLFILLAAGVGFLLPSEFEGAHAITLPQEPREVWAAVADFQRFPVAGRHTEAVERLPNETGLPVWREDLGEISLEVRTLSSDAPDRVVRRLRGLGTPLDAEFSVELVQVPGGTKVTATQHVTVEGSSWAVPFSRWTHLLSGAERWAMDYLGFLREGLERGSTPSGSSG